MISELIEITEIYNRTVYKVLSIQQNKQYFQFRCRRRVTVCGYKTFKVEVKAGIVRRVASCRKITSGAE